MSEFGMDVTTPVGRIVWGHPTKPRPKKYRTGPQKGQPMLDNNGQPIQEVSFGVAFSKADFTAGIWPTMAAEIATGYPNAIPGKFAYKYVDGDGIDGDGKPYSDREGYAGCYVLAFTQRINDLFPVPPVFKLEGNAYRQLGPDEIKCGDYVSVGTNFKVHVASGSDDTPSIYVNPKGIELVGYGAAIVSAGQSADPNAMFGGRQHQLPPGASATPMQQPGAPMMPGMGAPQAPAMPGGMPTPGAAPMALAVPAAPMAPAAPVAPQPPAIQRPTDPSHIHAPGTPGEMWWINGTWQTPPAAAPQLPPPAPDFVQQAMGTPASVPTMPAMPGAPMAPAAPMAAPGGMPGMMPPR